MPHAYHNLAFTPAVKKVQETLGSRRAYGRMESHPAVMGDVMGPQEAEFIAERDSFYMATVNSEGWPYVQHRGGAPGFVKVLDEKTFGFADYTGNQQRISQGNVAGDDRASVIFMDYPNRARLKAFGRLQPVAADAREDLMTALDDDRQEGAPDPQFAWLFHVAAVDWNCPKYITPRFSADLVRPVVEKLETRIAELESRLTALGEKV